MSLTAICYLQQNAHTYSNIEGLQITKRKCQTTSVFRLQQFRKTENNYVEVKYSSQAETPLKSHSASSLFPKSRAVDHLGLKLKSTQM